MAIIKYLLLFLLYLTLSKGKSDPCKLVINEVNIKNQENEDKNQFVELRAGN